MTEPAPGPRPLDQSRPARVYRYASGGRHTDVDGAAARVGDLLTSEGWPTLWYVRLRYGWLHMPSRAVRDGVLSLPTPDVDWAVVGLEATDQCADALAHYGNAIREQDATPPSAGHSAQRLMLDVRPSDSGLRDAFDLPDCDWPLVERWQSIRVVWHAEAWRIERADFGNGLVFRIDAATQCALQHTSIESDVLATRNLAALVACYRASLEPTRHAFLVFEKTCRSIHRLSGLREHVVDMLAPFWWQVQAQKSVLWSGEFCFALRICGPRNTTDLSRIAAALGAPYLETAFHFALRTAVAENASGAAGELYRVLEQGRANLLVPVRWSDGEYQWPAVHRFLLDRALALAPLALPTYVLLWLLEWLPEMRHHVHSRAVRLLEAVRASVQRVCGRR